VYVVGKISVFVSMDILLLMNQMFYATTNKKIELFQWWKIYLCE